MGNVVKLVSSLDRKVLVLTMGRGANLRKEGKGEEEGGKGKREKIKEKKAKEKERKGGRGN